MDNVPRKPWLSVLLTIFSLGLGHLYIGKAKKGIMLFLIFQILIILGFFSFFYAPIGPIIFLSLGLLFVIFCIFDAVKLSKKLKLSYVVKRYNKWYVYLLYFVVASFVVQPIVQATLKRNIAQAYKIPSGGMKPTLQIGDHIISDKLIYKYSDPKKGDIVIFPYPEDPSKDFIKRVIAVGGETIESVNKQIFINGKILKEPFVIHSDSYIFPKGVQPRDNFGPFKVPDDSLFVMGDNRDQSFDSRFWGFVKKSSVRGKAISIYWSWDEKNQSIRWKRIGKNIDHIPTAGKIAEYAAIHIQNDFKKDKESTVSSLDKTKLTTEEKPKKISDENSRDIIRELEDSCRDQIISLGYKANKVILFDVIDMKKDFHVFCFLYRSDDFTGAYFLSPNANRYVIYNTDEDMLNFKKLIKMSPEKKRDYIRSDFIKYAKFEFPK